jgi:hypothetical protein
MRHRLLRLSPRGCTRRWRSKCCTGFWTMSGVFVIVKMACAIMLFKRTLWPCVPRICLCQEQVKINIVE